MINWVTRLSVATFAILLLSSCVGTKYPDSWADKDTAATCHGLSGTYSQIGEYADTSQHIYQHSDTPKLTNLLFATDVQAVANADRVKIQISADDTLTASALLGDDILGAIELNNANSNFRCTKSGAILESRSRMSGSESGEVLVGFDHYAITLTLTSDGALLLEKTEYAAGLAFLFVPIAVHSVSRTRFPRYGGGGRDHR